MKNILYKQVVYSNFAGAAYKNFTFNPSRNRILGSNGKGKTTLLNVISYALTGKGINGETVFIEPIGEDGKPKENITTSVSLTINVDQKDYIISRTLENNSITALSINDIKYKLKKDFDKALKDLLGIDGKEFFLMSNSRFFNSLPTKDARKYILDIVGEVSDQEAFNACEQGFYSDLIKQNIEGNISLNSQRQNKKDEIVLIEKDMEKYKNFVFSKQESLNKITQDIKQQDFDYATLTIERDRIKKEIDEATKHNESISKREMDLAVKELAIKTNKERIAEFTKKRDEIRLLILNLDNERDAIKKDFDILSAKLINDKCTLCGGVTSISIQEAEKNKQKSLDDINKKGQKKNADIASAKAKYNSVVKSIEEFEQSIKTTQLEIKAILFPKPKIDVSALNEKFQKAVNLIGNQEAIQSIHQEIKELNTQIDIKKTLFDRACAEKLAIDKVFIKKIELIESSVNSQLDGIQVKLFDILKNGNVDEIFTITEKGIDFNRMNFASQISSGIKLLNFIQSKKGMCLPIFIENGESIQNVPFTNSQTFEAVVAQSELEIK